MTTAVPQRTVSICLLGRTADDAQISYSYWSPNDGMVRVASPICDMVNKKATNTLFVLDYPTTLNGWNIVGTKPKHPGAPTLATAVGPANTSIITFDPCLIKGDFAFYIIYENTITQSKVYFDPQEGNEPGLPN